MLERRLNQKANYVPELYSYVFYTERISPALAKMKQFFILTENSYTDYQNMKNYTHACMEYARKSYPGLPRGIMGGLVVYQVMC